jgi:adenylate cyclase
VIIAGEETAARATKFAFLELDLLKVKGKTEATRIFALMGDDKFLQSDTFKKLAAKHQEFLSKYRGMDWDGAETLLEDCEALNVQSLTGLYTLYRERIAAFRLTPPPEKWDGTAQATSK